MGDLDDLRGEWQAKQNQLPKRDWGWLGGTVALVLTASAVVGLAFWGLWYQADIQRAVYARQGCKMTTWEILMGAKPIERNFTTPEKEAKP